MEKPIVSIIIPAYNEEAVIGRLLLSIQKQTYKECEAIVVDDASTDDTVAIAKKYTKDVFTRKHAERSVQRNFGAREAKADYLLFLDADMELIPNIVESCVALLENDKQIGAIAIPETPFFNSFWEKVKGFERSFYSEKGDEATDAARFFTREAFEKAGGYDETITGPEDWDLPETVKKLGFKLGRIEERINHYERVPNPFILAKKKYYYGLKAHRYFEKQGVPLVGAKTIYILRPVFYRNWRKLLAHPVLTIAMFFMLTLEQVGGGLGFLVGKMRNL